MKIAFLMHSTDRIGGITRATLTTAASLAARGHQVEIAAVFRLPSNGPRFAVDSRVHLTCLTETGRSVKASDSKRQRVLAGTRSPVYPQGDAFDSSAYSRLTDKLVANYLRTCGADVILATAPGLNVYLAHYAPANVVTIGQEHLFHDHHVPQLREKLLKAITRLDGLVTVSAADADTYRAALPRCSQKVHFIPNPVPAVASPQGEQQSKTIIAAGRLAEAKNFRLLIDAFKIVNRKHPDWQLRIYGSGDQAGPLTTQINRLRLSNAASLMGQITPMDDVWPSGAIAAVPSDRESFGLTIVEAMRYGLPVVATNCPHGPPEIITHRGDGLLTPVGNVAAFASALNTLIDDDAQRAEMSQMAKVTARQYEPQQVISQYEALFAALIAAKKPMRRNPHRMTPRLATTAKTASYHR